MKNTLRLLPYLTILFVFSGCNLFSAVGLNSQGQPVKEVTGILDSGEYAFEEIVDHSQWDGLLKKYVSKDGLVDYRNFLKDREALTNYLQMLSVQNPSEDWSVQELLAYYINTYNAYTVDLILDNYPVKSIKDISRAWTKAIIPIGDTKLSLAGVENGILRKMNEPRIHFAINCASYSCPNLLNEAYTASEINQQLKKVTIAFINSSKNDITPDTPKISSIFDWYKKDFTVNGKRDVIGYINQYSTVKINPDSKVKYKDYNWNLNE